MITKLGECVSVDQLESYMPGLIAQLRGTLTKARYKAATVFVDHFSGLGYMHLQQSTSAEATIEAKETFERYAALHQVSMLHYHADNGIFMDNKFRQAVSQKGQTISFCGINVHFQNGRAKRRIRDLQDHTRTMLVHTQAQWSTAINAHLWPYALQMANDIFNNTPLIKTQKVPIQMFSNSPVDDDLKHWHHFSCPVYVPHSDLQSGKARDKWANKSRVAIYLGRSLTHARTIALCLSLTTGLTSPQFHFKVDSTFQMLCPAFHHQLPQLQWQSRCHFLGATDGGHTT